MLRYCRLCIAIVLMIYSICMGGVAWASASYNFVLEENWIPPETTAVELGRLIIEINPLFEGEHSALFALPSGFEINMTDGGISSIQNPLVVFTPTIMSKNEFIGKISNHEVGKYTFVIPIKSTIPIGIRGDINLIITSISGQLTSGAVIAGAVLPGELTIESNLVGAIKDGKSTVQLTFTENMAGLLSKSSPIKLTLPEGFAWSNAKFELVTGESLDVRPVTDDRVLELRTIRESTKRSIYCVEAEVSVSSVEKAKSGEVRVEIEGLSGLSSQTVLVANYKAPEPESVEPQAVFTVGSNDYKHHGAVREMDIVPFIRDGRVFLPLRYVAVSLDVDDISWNEQTVTMEKDGIMVQVTAGSRSIMVNGKVLTMDVAPELASPGRIMLPYRYIAEAFEASVGWDEVNMSVVILPN